MVITLSVTSNAQVYSVYISFVVFATNPKTIKGG